MQPTGTDAGQPNWGGYEQPAYLRHRPAVEGGESGDTSYDLLDVPAFLRRQAD
jgi:hypothetical protein